MNDHNHKPRAPRADGRKCVLWQGKIMRIPTWAAYDAVVRNGAHYTTKAKWKEQERGKVSS